MRNSRRNRSGQEESSKLHKKPLSYLDAGRIGDVISYHNPAKGFSCICVSPARRRRRADFFTSFENIQRDRFAYPRLAAPVGVKIVSPLQRRIQSFGIGGVGNDCSTEERRVGEEWVEQCSSWWVP